MHLRTDITPEQTGGSQAGGPTTRVRTNETKSLTCSTAENALIRPAALLTQAWTYAFPQHGLSDMIR